MSLMIADKNNIEIFVRHILGCECPDEVFRHIDCQYNVTLTNDILLRNKINIGNRLLIYIIEVNNTDFIENKLRTLVSVGKTTRDIHGFNRLRIVIATDKKKEVGDAAESIFKTLESVDEKVYLHIIPQNALQI